MPNSEVFQRPMSQSTTGDSQLARLSRQVGWWMRVALGCVCSGLLLLECITLYRSTEPFTAVDLVFAVIVTGVLGLLLLPGVRARYVRSKLTALMFGVAVASMLIESYLRVCQPFPVLLRAGRIDLPFNTSHEFDSGGMLGLDSKIRVSFNSLGFRGSEPPQRWEDALTVVCVGGSTTQCIYLSEGTTWPDQLSESLSQQFKGVWVNNAGLDGHSTFGHLQLVEQVIAPLHPKMVLFYVGLNDVDRSDLTFGDVSTLRSTARSDESFVRWSQRFMLRHFDTVALFDSLRLQAAAKRKGLTHGGAIQHAPLAQSADTRPLTAADRQRWLESRDPACLVGYEARLKLLLKHCREANIECVLITQAVLYGEGVDPETGIDLESVRVVESDGWSQWQLLKQYNRATEQTAAEADVPLIDLASRMPKSSRYFYDLTHFNKAGAAKAAKLIEESLVLILRDRDEMGK